jgi:hypothetical protein
MKEEVGTMDERANHILSVLSLVLVMAIALTSLGIAYAGGVRGVGLMSVCFFLTLGIVVVLAQSIPAGVLLSSLAGVLFSLHQRMELPIRAA